MSPDLPKKQIEKMSADTRTPRTDELLDAHHRPCQATVPSPFDLITSLTELARALERELAAKGEELATAREMVALAINASHAACQNAVRDDVNTWGRIAADQRTVERWLSDTAPPPERPEGHAVNCGVCGDLGTVFPAGDPCNCRVGRMLAEGITEEDCFIPYSERP